MFDQKQIALLAPVRRPIIQRTNHNSDLPVKPVLCLKTRLHVRRLQPICWHLNFVPFGKLSPIQQWVRPMPRIYRLLDHRPIDEVSAFDVPDNPLPLIQVTAFPLDAKLHALREAWINVSDMSILDTNVFDATKWCQSFEREYVLSCVPVMTETIPYEPYV
jgi:hypothetical protein